MRAIVKKADGRTIKDFAEPMAKMAGLKSYAVTLNGVGVDGSTMGAHVIDGDEVEVRDIYAPEVVLEPPSGTEIWRRDTRFKDAAEERKSAEESATEDLERAMSQDFPTYPNFYYPPYSEAFGRLTTHLVVRGVDTGLVAYKDHLFRICSGPGDCEHQLWHVGKMEAE